MPPKTIPMVQHLDKYGFRIWKNFVRKFSDKVLLEQIPVDLFQRDNVFKLQAIVHNQLSSPRYIRMWKFSWYACSYSESHPSHFENPVFFTFDFNTNCISCYNCFVHAFAKCSWCKQLFGTFNNTFQKGKNSQIFVI